MHKCLGCGRVYDDDAPELTTGCSCGSKYFLYYKRNSIDKKSKEEVKRIEEDILDIINANRSSLPKDKPVIFDIESIFIPKQGKYIIDLEKVFKEKAIVFKIEEGKYIIDMSKLK